LLFVYMMAASVAILLYMELPRVAFEAQREKEQLLIDRGEAYERGIQLYFRKFHQYPPTLDALDKTQEIRFIRRRYPDPMTGKDDWRVIHVGAGGVLTDSLLNKGKSLAPASSQKQTFVSEIALVNATNVTPENGNPSANLAARRRPSDMPGAPGSPGAPPVANDPNNPNAPIDPAAAAAAVPGQPLPGQPGPGQPIPGANGSSMVLPDGRVVPMVNGLPGGTGQMAPGQQANALPGSTAQMPFGQQANGLPAAANSGIPGQSNPYAQSSMPGQPGGPPAGAAGLINQILTSPRPGGLNGLATGPAPGQPTNSPFGTPAGVGQVGTPASAMTSGTANNTGTPITGTTGQMIGGGIAGVATKVDGEGIKVYNERSKYKEWEFIYDLSKDTGMTGGRPVPQGQNGMNGVNGINGMNGVNGTNGIGSSNSFGTSSSQPSPFGNQPQPGFGTQTPLTTSPIAPSTPQQ
jgi:hypothetical protein